jgi:hypothetical protein
MLRKSAQNKRWQMRSSLSFAFFLSLHNQFYRSHKTIFNKNFFSLQVIFYFVDNFRIFVNFGRRPPWTRPPLGVR